MAALVEQNRGPKSPHPNRVAPEIEELILALCLERPTYGAQRIANELRLQNVDVSPSGVRGVWLRHDLTTRHQRLLRLKTRAQDDTVALRDEQIRLLERHSCEFRMRHVEVSAPGELLNQDTFRLRDDGSSPEDNSFVVQAGYLPEIWSLGHRSPQELAVHPDTVEPWKNEHGPLGGDEINVVRPGRYYGWLLVSYGAGYDGT